MAPGLVMVLSLVWLAAASASSSREQSLLQTWGQALDSNSAGEQETPISRVVNLLKEMQETLQKEMKEDEELYDKLACWCNNNMYEKNEAIEVAQAKIAELEAKIEELTAKSAELKSVIAETTKELEADKE